MNDLASKKTSEVSDGFSAKTLYRKRTMLWHEQSVKIIAPKPSIDRYRVLCKQICKSFIDICLCKKTRIFRYVVLAEHFKNIINQSLVPKQILAFYLI